MNRPLFCNQIHRYPEPIPGGTAVPQWAFIDPTVSVSPATHHINVFRTVSHHLRPTAHGITTLPLRSHKHVSKPHATENPSSCLPAKPDEPDATAISSTPASATSTATLLGQGNGNSNVTDVGQSPASTGSGKKINIGAIIGGVLGGVGSAAAIATIIVLYLRLRARRGTRVTVDLDDPCEDMDATGPLSVTPYVSIILCVAHRTFGSR